MTHYPSLDRFLRAALDSLTVGRGSDDPTVQHITAILDRVQPGEIGCVSCGHVAPSGAFTRPPRRHAGRRCPACTTNVDQNGYISGDIVAGQKAS